MSNYVKQPPQQVQSPLHPQQFFSSLAPAAQRIERALSDMRTGLPVLLMDDFDRENEVDLIVAAEKITIDSMARMIRDGSGIVCLCITDALANHLQLAPMVQDNQSRFSTAFTVSIEGRQGVSTGYPRLIAWPPLWQPSMITLLQMIWRDLGMYFHYALRKMVC